uniref:Aldehyde dehydrogenase domain-containing protein n=1 Tax=Tetradesmus obliquus TaxID=3088 RepID=A0A383W5Q6_TETOB|eukprot:jgi/Sobl393_1/6074/SZX72975.1
MDALQMLENALEAPQQALAVLGLAVALAGLLYLLLDAIRYRSIPELNVPITEQEASEQLQGAELYTPTTQLPKDKIPCYDPSSMQFLGYAKAMSPAEVRAVIAEAKQAAQVWRSSSFGQRRRLLKVLLKYIIAHQQEICRVSARDSGKTPLEAVLGEIVVTAEKLSWLIKEGEAALKPSQRGAGVMAFYKSARVEFIPVGVVGAIVPWNWPFHNIINPISAAVMAGNAIVVKVSEHSSWSIAYYGRIVEAALAAAGAPPGLVRFVTGYGDAGHALVTGGVDKVVFVGSTEVGKKVMAAAADRLTPVTLELGGKDAFVVCEDADLNQVVPIAIKAAFLNCGQNCASGERFIVQRKVYGKFCERVTEVAKSMRQGPTLGAGPMDAGAMCMPGSVQKVQRLIDDAVAKGATVLAGGKPGPANWHPQQQQQSQAAAAAPAAAAVAAAENGGAVPPPSPARLTRRSAAAAAAAAGGSSDGSSSSSVGQFYPPTVITGVTQEMDLYYEEAFGPVMTVIPFDTDDEAVAFANDCPFGLGSSVFSGSKRRARAIASRLEAGMSSINDFNATYMCQGLPFGGVKQSGFGRFAGVEGLRALCVPKAVAEDAWPFMKTSIPPLWQHPVGPAAAPFAVALTTMFYGPSIGTKLAGLVGVLKAVTGVGMASSSGGSSKAKSKAC